MLICIEARRLMRCLPKGRESKEHCSSLPGRGMNRDAIVSALAATLPRVPLVRRSTIARHKGDTGPLQERSAHARVSSCDEEQWRMAATPRTHCTSVSALQRARSDRQESPNHVMRVTTRHGFCSLFFFFFLVLQK